MDKKSFLEMNKGAILERFDYELGRVFDNIMDPNTPATKPRKLQITVEFKADSDRVQVNHSAYSLQIRFPGQWLLLKPIPVCSLLKCCRRFLASSA